MRLLFSTATQRIGQTGEWTTYNGMETFIRWQKWNSLNCLSYIYGLQGRWCFL